MKVIAFNGSARKDGNTAILTKVVLKELEKEGIETELVQMAGQKIAPLRNLITVDSGNASGPVKIIYGQRFGYIPDGRISVGNPQSQVCILPPRQIRFEIANFLQDLFSNHHRNRGCRKTSRIGQQVIVKIIPPG